jgi:hypothetical protein
MAALLVGVWASLVFISYYTYAALEELRAIRSAVDRAERRQQP